MARVRSIVDPGYICNQYRDATNLNLRIRLHREFSTNPYGWQRWLFDQLKLAPDARILELGCGSGQLWFENAERLPAGLEIILSDLSMGMLQQVQQHLASRRQTCQVCVIDAHAIPFEKASFDVVLANHMLYHVQDLARALKEIRRVLKPSGCFFSSTIGENHLKELTALIYRFDVRLSSWGTLPPDSFTLESGADKLGKYFGDVSCYRYPDALIVTDASLLMAYILSGRLELTSGQQNALEKLVVREFKTNGGKFFITKDSGVFVSQGTLPIT